jgi:tetratricopeptide (TPR) repeat protein
MSCRRFQFLRVGETWLLVFALTLLSPSIQARYRNPDLVNIPVERLIKNLEALAIKDPKDVQVRFNLARVHAMAFALKTDTAQIRKDDEKAGAWFGYAPANVPFDVKPTNDKNELRIARRHLAESIKRYEEVLKLSPDNLVARLGYAWSVEQSGQKQRAIKEYRKVIEAAWEKEKEMRRAPLGWHSVTAEASGYLIPLLDPDRDKKEIKTLEDRRDQTSRLPRPVTPVVVPLSNGLDVRDLEDHSANVAFDADGTGLKKNWSWITKDAGWLVFDPHRTGKVDSALQLFGGVTFWMFWENGYQALGALDDDGDAVLKGKELHGLAIWQDVNANGVCEPGEVKPVASWGVVAISCRYVRDAKHPDRIAYSPEGVYFRDGSTRPTYDIILRGRSAP